jgi:hypothetical protein
MVALEFAQNIPRLSWASPRILRARLAGPRALTWPSLHWTLIVAALSLIQGGAIQAGVLTDATLWLHVWELPAVEFPADVAAGVSVSDTEFYVDSGAEFSGATSVENTSTSLYSSGFHLHVEDALAGTFTGVTRSSVAGVMRIHGDWGPGFQTVWYPELILGTTTTVDCTYCQGWSIVAKGWTVGQAVISGVTTLTPSGALNTDGTATYTGSNGLTSLGGGTIQMVSPTIFHTSDYWYDPSTVAGFVVLELTYAPEPTSLVMLLSGSLLLLILGRRKMRARPRGSGEAAPAAVRGAAILGGDG